MIKVGQYARTNTPQELIQDGDLIRYQAGSHSLIDEVRRVEEEHIYMKSGATTSEFITEIWTKTDKDTYKCQWRKQ